MALDLRDCTFFGPALPEPFVKFQLEAELQKRKLLPRMTADDLRALEERWESYRRKLRALGEQGGDRRVAAHVLEPLAARLGYERFERQGEVITREGPEDGGWLLSGAGGRVLRAWAVGLGTDLDAPSRRGRAYRFSPSRMAQRVLLAGSERVGLLTDGEELRLLLCDPARPDSHIAVRLDRSGGWRAARGVPDSYRLLLALASPAGVAALPDLADAARLAQSAITRKLRLQARRAIEGFLQEVLDNPANAERLAASAEPGPLGPALWREGLILVYRLLFVLKLESSADPARAFSFAATSLWRNTYSPSTALADRVRDVLDRGADSGGFLEGGLRTLWRMFAEGLSSSELEVKPLGGMLFGTGTTPLLDAFQWGERSVARLLDSLLWTPRDGKTERERVHYGSLDVEDLGRVYEALLELEPGITTEPMCRLRRAKLEVVVPTAQGAAYRSTPAASAGDQEHDRQNHDEQDDDDHEHQAEEDHDNEEESSKRSGKGSRDGGAKTQVEFIEEIPAGRFFLRVGLGRKATGSYYTPHPFVRFLVQETLGPQLAERSPREDPHPEQILDLKVLDPAMGSGHFLVEACRYLGDALYEACRLCDELAVQAEEQAAARAPGAERESLLARADDYRRRVEQLPDPQNELVVYLPSRVPEGEESGLSQKKAEALCRRLVAVHCLYGADKNPLAVELAKLSLWLESYAEGLPLTFMDHRLVPGDSLTGPFFEHLLTYPKSGERLDDLFNDKLTARLQATLATALTHVRDLEASVGKDAADVELKRAAKRRLDAALEPLKTLAAAWSGGVMLGDACDDAAYQALAEAVGRGGDPEGVLAATPRLREMVKLGKPGVAFDLAFPEVFHRGEASRPGFDAVIGNPPWDIITLKREEWFSSFDFQYLATVGKSGREAVEARVLAVPERRRLFHDYCASFESRKRSNDRLYTYQKVTVAGELAGRFLDEFRVFMERNAQLLRKGGFTGVVVPSAFHANAGATGVRRLYLEKMSLRCCFSFENRKKLFDIDSRFKFAAVVAKNDQAGTNEFECGFYWHELERLFDGASRMHLDMGFVRATGGDYLVFLEARSNIDAAVIRTVFRHTVSLGDLAAEGLVLRTNPVALNLTLESRRFTRAEDLGTLAAPLRDPRSVSTLAVSGLCPLHEGKTYHQYQDTWDYPVRYLVHLSRCVDKGAEWYGSLVHFRLSYREIASSTNERTLIAALLQPGVCTGHKAPIEASPGSRPDAAALCLLAVVNAFVPDYAVRQRVQSTVSLFVVRALPLPSLTGAKPLLAHSALRLSCNHAGYAPLWEEQVGDEWHEPKPKHAWPVLEGDDERWAVRAAIDAVVADAYGLDRAQYEHVLSTFTHKSYPKAPERCLAAFDELKSIGLEAFTRKHDPYWDIPLNENLPKPVIDLPIPIEAETGQGGSGSLFDGLDDDAQPHTRSGKKPRMPRKNRKVPNG